MASNSTEMIVLSVKAAYISAIWKNIAFWLLLFGELMATPCYLFMFYHLFGRKVPRQTLQNHAPFILLSFNFIQLMIDVSMTLDYLRLGYRSAFIPAICLFHTYVNYSMWYGAVSLMLWISIERHILIFHSTLVATARGRFLFHYIPLAVASLYTPILYFYLIVLCPCQRVYNPLKNLCGSICYYDIVPAWFNWFESLVNYVIPILLIAVFSVGLIVRVIVQKRHLQQAVGWRRHRKMIVQLTLISLVYLVFDLPYVVIMIVQWSGIPTFASTIIMPYIAYLTYVPTIVLPYATLMALPNINQKLRALIICRANQRAVGPLIGRT